MKILISLFVLIFMSFSVISQENKFVNNTLKSGTNLNDYGIQADSILTFQFTSENDSNIYQKQYNRVNEQTQTAIYESWTWNSFYQSWSKYMAETVTNNSTEFITTFNWNNDSNKYLPAGQSENRIQENYNEYTYSAYDNNLKLFVPQSKSEKWLTHFEKDSLYFEYIKDNVSGGLIYNRKIASVYDTLQNIIQENKYNWENNNWVLKAKNEFGYDTLGNKTQVDGFMSFYNELLNTTRSIYTYDSLHHLINETTKLFNNNTWVNSSNNSYEFDSEGRNFYTLNQTWDLANSQWLNTTKTEVTFENVELKSTVASGISTTAKMFQWLPAGTWEPLSESVSITNDLGIANEYSGKSWNTNTQTWTNFYRMTSLWDVQNQLTLFQSYANKNTEEEDWRFASKTYYYYNGINVFQGVNETELSKMLVYPNPATSHFSIVQKQPKKIQLKLYNLAGQLIIHETKSQNIIPVNIQHLKNGTYILQLSDGQSTFSKKIVKTN